MLRALSLRFAQGFGLGLLTMTKRVTEKTYSVSQAIPPVSHYVSGNSSQGKIPGTTDLVQIDG